MGTQVARNYAAEQSSAALFARNFFKYPSMLGSIVPSSRFLVRRLMRQIDWERARVLVELGPGVGTITREVLKRMRQDAVLVVIELNHEFVEHLRNTIRDPRVRIVHASAAHVLSIVAEQGVAPADYIISSLPYSLLPVALRKEIIAASRQVLRAEGSMLVFQFNRRVLPHLKSHFSSVAVSLFLLNFLPVLIFHCTP
jgi:phospholipid N-methyltransferase